MKKNPALDAAVARLRDAGVESPRLVAELLLAHVEGVTRAGLLARDEVDAAGFEPLVRRAAAREPVAYLTGRTEAYGLALDVEPGVFIPRPCTDTLIDLSLQSLPPGEDGELHVVDVGCGSGNIAVALAYHLQSSVRGKDRRLRTGDRGLHVTAVDIIQPTVARRNAARHGVRVDFVRGDLLTWTRARFDVIVSNPPYVGSPADVAPEVRYEPDAALYGGLDVIRRLVAQAPSRLRPGGRLLLEFGFDQAEDVRELLRGSFRDVEIFPDLEGIPRFARAVCG